MRRPLLFLRSWRWLRSMDKQQHRSPPQQQQQHAAGAARSKQQRESPRGGAPPLLLLAAGVATVGTEHLLLGLLRSGGQACRVLELLGAQPLTARLQVGRGHSSASSFSGALSLRVRQAALLCTMRLAMGRNASCWLAACWHPPASQASRTVSIQQQRCLHAGPLRAGAAG